MEFKFKKKKIKEVVIMKIIAPHVAIFDIDVILALNKR